MTLLSSVLLLCASSLLLASSSDVHSCCRRTYNKRVKKHLLESYVLQVDVPMCPVKAVKFVTFKGVRLCLDPSNRWAKTAMAYLEKRSKPPPARKPFHNLPQPSTDPPARKPFHNLPLTTTSDVSHKTANAVLDLIKSAQHSRSLNTHNLLNTPDP